MLWVTRHNPHVDRCSSAWLIKRFIDKKAGFIFISKDDPLPSGAIAFTLPKAEARARSTIMLSLLMLGTLELVFNIQLGWASRTVCQNTIGATARALLRRGRK